MKRIRKMFEVRGASLDENRISGGPAVMGNMDRGADVIYPGAFKSALPEFLKSGFVAVGHKWDELPVAMPVSAQEKGNVLHSEAVFHSTPAAQAARTVASERLAQGLSVGLSIGFGMENDDFAFHPNGATLLAHAQKSGCDMSLFDKSIAQFNGPCRSIMSVSELYEWSIVPVPMNPAASADSAKSYAWFDDYDDDDDDTTTADVAWAALSALYWDLRDDIWNCLYYSDMTVEEIIAELRQEYTEFASDSIAVLEAILRALSTSTGTDDVKAFGERLKVVWGRKAPEVRTKRDFERRLRDAGLSRTIARTAASKALRDAERTSETEPETAHDETRLKQLRLRTRTLGVLA